VSLTTAVLYGTYEGLICYRNLVDNLLHQLRTIMHHRLDNQERALNLSILIPSRPDESPYVELNSSIIQHLLGLNMSY
jgi:hypothetical protein